MIPPVLGATSCHRRWSITLHPAGGPAGPSKTNEFDGTLLRDLARYRFLHEPLAAIVRGREPRSPLMSYTQDDLRLAWLAAGSQLLRQPAAAAAAGARAVSDPALRRERRVQQRGEDLRRDLAQRAPGGWRRPSGGTIKGAASPSSCASCRPRSSSWPCSVVGCPTPCSPVRSRVRRSAGSDAASVS